MIGIIIPAVLSYHSANYPETLQWLQIKPVLNEIKLLHLF